VGKQLAGLKNVHVMSKNNKVAMENETHPRLLLLWNGTCFFFFCDFFLSLLRAFLREALPYLLLPGQQYFHRIVVGSKYVVRDDKLKGRKCCVPPACCFERECMIWTVLQTKIPTQNNFVFLIQFQFFVPHQNLNTAVAPSKKRLHRQADSLGLLLIAASYQRRQRVENVRL